MRMNPEEFLAQENVKYSDWFGDGSTHEDFIDAVANHGRPETVMRDGCMIALVYSDKIVVCGYDGNEYTHQFVFKNIKDG